jgi:hypothetical protein
MNGDGDGEWAGPATDTINTNTLIPTSTYSFPLRLSNSSYTPVVIKLLYNHNTVYFL